MSESQHQLHELLADCDFERALTIAAGDVMRLWNMSYDTARGFVLSAIGEPAVLAKIHHAWMEPNHGLGKVIVRRRVQDLLRKDARPASHCSLPAMPDELGPDTTPGIGQDLEWKVDLERRLFAQRILEVLDCFAELGPVEHRQAGLLRRRVLDEASYSDLSTEMSTTGNALRGRVHVALRAFREYLRASDPELF